METHIEKMSGEEIAKWAVLFQRRYASEFSRNGGYSSMEVVYRAYIGSKIDLEDLSKGVPK